jgi:5-formyltetrahydrofolate cyclo-ligase
MESVFDKKLMRKEILKNRNGMPPGERAMKSARIIERLKELPDIHNASTMMVFLNFGSEVEMDGIISWGWEMGKRIIAPLCFPETREMDPCIINDFSDLETGNYGIREPKAASARLVPHGEIDVVLIPAVAFDRRGQRIGYGGGYYDRFLPKVPRAARIGVIFASQIIPEFSVGPYDTPAGLVVTEEGVMEPATAA